jgi:hypothetical protein
LLQVPIVVGIRVGGASGQVGWMTKPAPARYRVTNWTWYNAALRRRGSPLIWVDREMTWRGSRDGRPGRPAVFSGAAIQFCLSVKVLLKLPLRQAVGMAEALPALAGLDWAVPDCSTLCRQQRTLAVQIPCRRADGPLHLLADSTGISSSAMANGRRASTGRSGGGEPCRAIGPSGNGERRKVHLAMDAATSDIRAAEFTPGRDGDSPVLPDLLGQVPEEDEIGTVHRRRRL